MGGKIHIKIDIVRNRKRHGRAYKKTEQWQIAKCRLLSRSGKKRKNRKTKADMQRKLETRHGHGWNELT